MRRNGLRQRQTRGQKKRRPVNAVKPNDLLADKVQVSRPVLFKLLLFSRIVGAIANGGHVVGQSIQPDINDMLPVAGNRNPPLETGARDAQVLQSPFDVGRTKRRLLRLSSLRDVAAQEAEDFIAAYFRLNQKLIALNQVNQLTLVV